MDLQTFILCLTAILLLALIVLFYDSEEHEPMRHFNIGRSEEQRGQIRAAFQRYKMALVTLPYSTIPERRSRHILTFITDRLDKDDTLPIEQRLLPSERGELRYYLHMFNLTSTMQRRSRRPSPGIVRCVMRGAFQSPMRTFRLHEEAEEDIPLMWNEQETPPPMLRPQLIRQYGYRRPPRNPAAEPGIPAECNRAAQIPAECNQAEPAPPRPQIEWRDDPENVHDTAINSALRQNFKLVKASAPQPLDDLLALLTDNRDLGVTPKTLDDAVALLVFIKYRDSDTLFVPFGCTEIEAIEHMYGFIVEKGFGNLLYNFVVNCADAYNEGAPRCLNGRMARLLSSFEFEDGMQPLHTTQAIRNHIFSKCSVMREEFLAGSNPAIVQQYVGGVENAETAALARKMQDEIRKKITDEFQHLENRLSPILDEAMAHL